MESIPIPKLTNDAQEQIAEHIRAAFANFDKFNELEDKAQKRLQVGLNGLKPNWNPE